MMREVLSTWSARIGLAIILAIVAMAIYAQLAYPDIPGKWNRPEAWSLYPKLAPPTWAVPNATQTIAVEGCRAVIEWPGGSPEDIRIEGSATKYVIVLTLPNGSSIVLDEGGGPSLYYSASIDQDLRELLGLGPLDNPAKYLMRDAGRYVFEIRGGCINAVIAVIGNSYGLLGTDSIGRDVWAGLTWGATISLTVGVVASIVATIIALVYGVANGLAGKLGDSIMTFMVDTLYNLPVLPILILITFAYGKPGPVTTAVLIGVFSWMGAARIIRGMVMQLRQNEYILLARVGGVPMPRLLTRYVLPAIAPYLVMTFVLSVPTAILTEAVLAFLGLTDPRLPSWGRMIEEAMDYVAEGYWWLWAPPGAMLVVTSLGFMLLGTAIEETINPRLSLAKQ